MIAKINNFSININDNITSISYEDNLMCISLKNSPSKTIKNIEMETFDNFRRNIIEKCNNMVFLKNNEIINVNNILYYEVLKNKVLKKQNHILRITLLNHGKDSVWDYAYNTELEIMMVTDLLDNAIDKTNIS